MRPRPSTRRLTTGASGAGSVSASAMVAVATVMAAVAVVAAVVVVPGVGAAPVAAASAPIAFAPNSGCGRPPVPGPTVGTVRAGASGDVVQSLVVGGVARSYRLAVPTHYRRRRATPLILLFHGSGSNAIQTSLYTGLPRRAAGAGYLVATPDAIDGKWDLSAPDTPTADLAYVRSLVGTLSARYCVDRRRIYATGISLGSEFAAIVGCTDPIAAIGLVAAEFPLRPCRSPLPVVAFHGTADPIVPYRSGGTGLFLPGVPSPGAVQNLGAWARLDRCAGAPHVRRLSTMVVRRTWSGCRHASSVVLYTVVGGGHTWPGSPVSLSAGTFGPTTGQIDATGSMLAFFGRYRLAG